MHPEAIAEICHEANRALCKGQGDLSQPGWLDAPQWQKDSAIAGVRFALEGDRKPCDSHDSWLKQKAADGWSWGPVKNPEKKEHPCMVPYDELPSEQKIKDHLFLAVVSVFK